MEEKRIALYQLMIGNETYTKDYASFEAQFFTNEAQTKKLWAFLLQNLMFTKTLKEFYTKFCCDLEWAKTTSYCGGTSGNSGTSGNAGTSGTAGSAGTSGNSGSALVDTTLTGDDLKNGKSVKYGMKGDIVGKIQQLLIDKGYKNISKSGKVDNLFGGRTKASVEEFQTNNGLTVDGAVGKDTWPKLNDPKAVTKGNATSTQTSNNNTPGADLQGTGDTYVSGSDAKIMEKDIPDVLKESVKKILRKSLLKHIK
jgi:hypothetical protein